MIVGKVAACNNNGCGQFSALNDQGTYIQTEPIAVNTPTEGAHTNEIQIEVLWTPQTAHEEIRGSPVTSYDLRWDAGSNGLEWYSLVGLESENLATGFIVSDYINGGEIYNFQVRSKNKWGWGDYSPVASIKASTWPIMATAPTTSINQADGAVIVQWDEPDHQGSLII